ncbi:16S rRNA (guanine(527)-N(7))-methyltransferase RsmG [soil metagenome]
MSLDHDSNGRSEAGARIIDAAASMNAMLTSKQGELLVRYLALLAKWNKVYNLTSVRDPDEMLVQHVYDSLAVIAPLARVAPDGDLSVIDVGSGGGLPGVVIAAAVPNARVTCVDAVGKKTSFINQVAAELGLRNLRAEHSRVEALKHPPADIVTSRAFSSLRDFVSLTERLLKPQGAWMALKGKIPTQELGDLPPSVHVFHVEQLKVTDLAAERCIVWMRKAAAP